MSPATRTETVSDDAVIEYFESSARKLDTVKLFQDTRKDRGGLTWQLRKQPAGPGGMSGPRDGTGRSRGAKFLQFLSDQALQWRIKLRPLHYLKPSPGLLIVEVELNWHPAGVRVIIPFPQFWIFIFTEKNLRDLTRPKALK